MRLRSLAMLCSLVVLASCSDGLPSAGGSHLGVQTPHDPIANPIWGGTVIFATHANLAVISDADHDKLWVTPLGMERVTSVAMPVGSSPSRMSEDSNGNVVVVLRGTGEVAVVDPAHGKLLSHTAVCPEPRSASFDAAQKVTLVGCQGGELVSVALDQTMTVTYPGRDLRDVVAVGSQLWATQFRAATVFPVAADGTAGAALTPPTFALPSNASFVPHVAWRTLATPNGDLLMVHQRAVDGPVTSIQLSNPVPAYYSNYCLSPVVRTAVTLVHGGTVVASVESSVNNPVDAAVSPNGALLTIVSPTQNVVQTSAVPQPGETSGGLCTSPGAAVPQDPQGQPVGVTYTPDGTLLVQTREPFGLNVYPPDKNGVPVTTPTLTVPLANYTKEHAAQTGFALFHTATAGGISCMSCHPEAGDDGHVWSLFEGMVRTQSLKGGLTQTAPFHWKGDLPDVTAVLTETLVKRMGGTMPAAAVSDDLGKWLDTVPSSRPSPTDPADVISKGQSLFTSAGCVSCHAGTALTNNTTVSVGTGGLFQVPSLRGVASHGPWLHDGCAQKLEDRFGPCGGTAHGNTSGLGPSEIASLVAYLRSL